LILIETWKKEIKPSPLTSIKKTAKIHDFLLHLCCAIYPFFQQNRLTAKTASISLSSFLSL